MLESFRVREKLVSRERHTGRSFLLGRGCNSVQQTLVVVRHLPLLPTRRERGFSAQEDLCWG